LSRWRRRRVEARCVDMWKPFGLSLEQWVPQCRIVYDKFHILQDANDAVEEVRRAEFFRRGRRCGSDQGETMAAADPVEEP
jgi:transposase